MPMQMPIPVLMTMLMSSRKVCIFPLPGLFNRLIQHKDERFVQPVAGYLGNHVMPNPAMRGGQWTLRSRSRLVGLRRGEDWKWFQKRNQWGRKLNLFIYHARAREFSLVPAGFLTAQFMQKTLFMKPWLWWESLATSIQYQRYGLGKILRQGNSVYTGSPKLKTTTLNQFWSAVPM